MMDGWVNQENIARSSADAEWHPLKPFVPEGARVLFLGSFPPPRQRWCIDFYYPNFINDHWRIEGLVWFQDKDHFIKGRKFDLEKIVEFCSQKGLAFHDTATAVRRLKGNASDKDLEVLVPTDIPALISTMPQLRCIVTTGERAAQTLCASLGIPGIPAVGGYVTAENGLKIYRLPSSSRAYPLPLEKKTEAYRKMFDTMYDE